MKLAKAIVLAVVAVLGAAPTLAQSRQQREDFNKQRFGGWGGLAFYCSMQPEDETNKSLCVWAGQRIRGLAKPLNVPVLITVSDAYQRQLDKQDNKPSDWLDVELDLFSTKGSPFALHAALKSGPFYGGAVETDSPTESEKKPRPGTLVLWQRATVASGLRGTEFETTVRQSLDTMLMQFVSDFADGR